MLELSIAVIVLVVLGAITSCAEAAIFSLPISKAKQMAEGTKSGKLICKIRENPSRSISTITIVNNTANIAGTYLITYLAISALSENDQKWFPYALTGTVILFCEIFPKTIGERYCKTVCQLVAIPLSTLTWILTPFVWAIEKITFLVIGENKAFTTDEAEIRLLAKIGHEEGSIDEDEKHMIERIFHLNDYVAKDIMTPRTELTFVRSYEYLQEIAPKIAASQHSRILVVGETIDNVKGVILKSVVLTALINKCPDDVFVEDRSEIPLFVSESTPADDLLSKFQKFKNHLAVVLDEYGGVSGVVTLEDVLEIITGEIVDETDECVDMQDAARKNGINKLDNPLVK